MTSSNQIRKNLQNYLHRLGRSLTGRYEPDLPDVRIRKCETLLDDLCVIPESDWAFYAFSREPMNGRFSDEERIDMYEQAARCGRQNAEKLIARYGKITAAELAEKLGLKVLFPQMPQSRSRILFAEFAEPDTIRVYKDGLQKGEILLQNPQISRHFPEGVRIENILIAHELFHVIEMRDPQIWTKNYRISLWKLGFYENTSPVAVLSEIAAMAFSQRINELTFSPYVLDCFLVYGYSPKAACALYEEMISHARRNAQSPAMKLICQAV